MEEHLIEQLAGYGVPGLLLGIIVFLLRGEIGKILSGKGGSADLADAMRETAQAMNGQLVQFQANNHLFGRVLEELRTVNERLEHIQMELVRQNKGR